MTLHFEVIRGGKKVTVCDNSIHHKPTPHRIIGHHIVPQCCGGPSTPANIAALCDNCHYAAHVGMWTLEHDIKRVPHLRLSNYVEQIARTGWAGAVALGTAALIPNEGTPE